MHGARWYWDARFLPDEDIEKMQAPLDDELVAEIDRALGRRCKEALWRLAWTM